MDKLLGYIGCSVMSLQGVPQVWRVIQTKSGTDLSYTTLLMGCAGGACTIAYGIMINEPPIYATVSFTVALNILLIGLKARYGHQNTLSSALELGDC